VEKITDRLIDKFGNNAVLACPACEKPYLTTGILKRAASARTAESRAPSSP
jgi:hypothetical protein